MKTVIYQQIQDQAAELAGRPKGKLPTSEYNILLMLFHTETQIMWNSQAWPDLLMYNSYTPINLNGVIYISALEASAGEIGDVLWAGTNDPRSTQGVRPSQIEFTRGNNQINLLRSTDGCAIPGTVWLEYQIPPNNVLAASLNPATAQPVIGYQGGVQTLANLLFPARFYHPLAAMGASKLLAIDGLLAQSAALKQMAQENLDWQSCQPEMTLPPWRGIKLKR